MKKRVPIYIIYLALFSFIVTGVSLSRYSKSVADSNNVAAAKTIVEYIPVSTTLNGVPITAKEGGLSVSDMKPGDVLVYHFNVTNFIGEDINQTLMKYCINVIFDPEPALIPVEYILSPDGIYPSAGENWTYISFESEETHGYTLTVTWDEALNDPEYLNQQQDIQIQINAEQVDSIS
jgi:hypothetical protein